MEAKRRALGVVRARSSGQGCSCLLEAEPDCIRGAREGESVRWSFLDGVRGR